MDVDQDLDSSENNPMTSTRIDDTMMANNSNSMSLLNEGFVIDSASLSLTAINDGSESLLIDQDQHPNTNSISEIEGTNETPTDSTEMRIDETEEEVGTEELMEESSETHAGKKSKRAKPVDIDDADDDENVTATQLPIGRVKKIMKICVSGDDGEESDTAKSKGKGNFLLSKEAIYLTTLATEYFIAAVGDMAGGITVASKKKTMTFDHLKTALSDSEAFDFLQGCFQPSVINGD